MAQPTPINPSNYSPYLQLARSLFALSAVSGCLYLNFRYTRLKKDAKEREERQQYFHEKQSMEEKQLSDIIIVLKKYNFLNILHKYKMQKITLKEPKNVLSAIFELSENKILNTV